MRSIVKGVPTFMYGEELSRQLALDYCCSPADVADSENHFSIYAPQEGRRRFQEALIRGLKIAVVNGKLLFTGSEEIVAECRKRYADVTGEWFFDAKRLREIEELLSGGLADLQTSVEQPKTDRVLKSTRTAVAVPPPCCAGASFFSAGSRCHAFLWHFFARCV